MDKLVVDLKGVVIQLPNSHVIVNRDEYDDLKSNADRGKYMTLKQLLTLLSVSRPWLLDNVLYNPKIRREIDVELNPNGFVKYPEIKVDAISFWQVKPNNGLKITSEKLWYNSLGKNLGYLMKEVTNGNF